MIDPAIDADSPRSHRETGPAVDLVTTDNGKLVLADDTVSLIKNYAGRHMAAVATSRSGGQSRKTADTI